MSKSNMAHRLQANEKIAGGIMRIMREQLDRAVGELSDSELGRQESVHQARHRMRHYWNSWQAERKRCFQ